MGFFSKGLKKEFKTGVVNEPSGFKPLKFYCIYKVEVIKEMVSVLIFLAHLYKSTEEQLLSSWCQGRQSQRTFWSKFLCDWQAVMYVGQVLLVMVAILVSQSVQSSR